MPGKRGCAHPDHEDFFLALGRRLRALRKERGWSIHHMVVNFGYYDTQWRKFEKGGPVTVDTLLKMATMFDLTLIDLLDGLDKFPRKALAEVAKESEVSRVAPKKAPAKRVAPSPRQSPELSQVHVSR